jgi:LPS-assembly lipoprotein
MSWSDRRSILGLLAALPLAACGFTPAYSPGGAATQLRNAILVDDPPDRLAYEFVGRLEERFGPPLEPAYRLAYQITTQKVELAVTTEGSILRYNVTGTVAFTLTDRTTGAVLTQGQATSFAAAAATEATIAAQAAEQDANSRLMIILADQVVTRLTAEAGRFLPPADG